MADFKTERKKHRGEQKSVTGLPINEDTIKDAAQRLEEYRNAKKVIDNKATQNHEWWRMRHWPQIQSQKADAGISKQKGEPKATSAWLFNSIINKHADIMDNFPKPNVLPRQQDDVADAKSLSDIVPVILEQNGYKKVYSNAAYDLVIDGGTITGVFWDSSKNDGLGDVAIKQTDVHNMFWKPGINDIQESPEVFSVAAVDNDRLIAMYPQMEGHTGNTSATVEYLHDDAIDQEKSKMSEVVDWYYKTTKIVPVIEDPETGEMVTREKTVLHFCKFCNGQLLYASENEPGMEEGFYHHGKFPFVFRVLFPVKDTPWGFGYVDVMKNPQMYIDALDEMISKNAFMKGKPRFWVKESAGINSQDFSNWEKDLLTFSGQIDDVIKPVEVPTIPAFVVNQKESKIEELKETSGNRDFSQGSTQSGVTAASAIAALQEAGSKLGRDVNRVMYQGHEEESYLVIELIRQFYSEPRSFRIDDTAGNYQFTEYSNENLNKVEQTETGEELRRRPVFDIKVVAEKQSPFSRAAQNETMKELYGLGLFAPQNAEPALVCLDGMEFEGKDSIKQQIQQNSLLMQQFQRMQQVIMQAEMVLPGIAAQAGLAPAPMPEESGGKKEPGTAEERAAKTDTDTTRTTKARLAASKQAAV